jgi:hypothetical protein
LAPEKAKVKKKFWLRFHHSIPIRSPIQTLEKLEIQGFMPAFHSPGLGFIHNLSTEPGNG